MKARDLTILLAPCDQSCSLFAFTLRYPVPLQLCPSHPGLLFEYIKQASALEPVPLLFLLPETLLCQITPLLISLLSACCCLDAILSLRPSLTSLHKIVASTHTLISVLCNSHSLCFTLFFSPYFFSIFCHHQTYYILTL